MPNVTLYDTRTRSLQPFNPRDPTKVQVGGGKPIDPNLRPAFELERDRLTAVLDGTVPPTIAAMPSAPTPVATAN